MIVQDKKEWLPNKTRPQRGDYVHTYKVDSGSDIGDLPVIPEICGGSIAFVINSSKVYMLGSNGWVEI